jgi:Family of unknown function (DUF5681)
MMKKGGKSTRLRGGHEPSIGSRTQFRTGESGNPGGRPRQSVSEAYRAQLSQSKKGDRQKRTYAELIADAQIRKALRGDTMAAKEVTDRVEGKARQAVDIGLEPMPDLNLRVCFIKSCAECAGKGLKYCPSGRPMAKASTREARDRPFRLL